MKIFVVGPAWIGDMVMSQSLYIRLKQQFPAAEIHVLAPDWCQTILDLMPEVDQHHPMPINHGELAIAKRRQIGQSLQPYQFDRAYILPNSLKSALIPYFAAIPKRIGWRGEMRYGLINDIRILDKAALPLMVERFVALADDGVAASTTKTSTTKTSSLAFAYPRLQLDQATADHLLQQQGLSTDRPMIAFCPGAQYGPAKQWPSRHWASLGQRLIEIGYQIWIFGSAADQTIADEIQTAIKDRQHCQPLTGKTPLFESIHLLSMAAACVTNDSGLMHVAAALSLPLVALYGSSSPAFTPPLANAKRVAMISKQFACSPCFKRECPYGHLACLNLITPEMVFDRLMPMIEADQNEPGKKIF